MAEDETRGRNDDLEEMKVACTTNGEMEAVAIKSALEAAGIQVELNFESLAKQLPVTVDGLGAVKVMVPADKLEEAKAIIATPAEPVGTIE
jgi:hypothetical protein